MGLKPSSLSAPALPPCSLSWWWVAQKTFSVHPLNSLLAHCGAFQQGTKGRSKHLGMKEQQVPSTGCLLGSLLFFCCHSSTSRGVLCTPEGGRGWEICWWLWVQPQHSCPCPRRDTWITPWITPAAPFPCSIGVHPSCAAQLVPHSPNSSCQWARSPPAC